MCPKTRRGIKRRLAPKVDKPPKKYAWKLPMMPQEQERLKDLADKSMQDYRYIVKDVMNQLVSSAEVRRVVRRYVREHERIVLKNRSKLPTRDIMLTTKQRILMKGCATRVGMKHLDFLGSFLDLYGRSAEMRKDMKTAMSKHLQKALDTKNKNPETLRAAENRRKLMERLNTHGGNAL